ncbi:protein phosphatase 1 regulatory subunit 26 [Python bivittatus]|uniref:Protein phosphatase 1 regulatory subunit 26 n=1 Tax=Python bivittatus TaxID=176946 RepID=A0A9F2WBN7_PYTBI|nr:protein phosphatase 1 regulatory subunit 26 [Python bivittatus]
MFLMNTSPLVALQRKWEPFPQSRNCRYPVCFSESEEDLARTAVNAKVQMIINNLQSEEVALGASSEYGCIMQKKQKGSKDSGHRFRRNDQRLQEHIKYTLRNCPADSDGMDMEDSAEFGPLSLNSDSDDSVDRDIEEAIQEYLRNKGQNIPPQPNNTENLPSKDEDQPVQQEYPSHDVACRLCPAGCGPVSVAQQYVVSDHVGDNVVQWASSPCSASSDDSFEQSIKAEIEQFLKKKKQQARKKITRRNKQFHQREEFQEKLAVSQKGSINRGNRNSLKQGGKVYFPKQHPELRSISTPKCLKSKTREEPAALKAEREADFSTPTVCYSSILEESKKSGKRQMLCNAGREERVSIDLSDSSSDDGIEEAIQRYQLEKIKKGPESRAAYVSLQKEEFSARKAENISPSLTSSLPEITQKAQSCRRKDASAKPAILSRLGATCNDLGKSRSHSPPEDSFAKCAVTFQASCRADTAAELMCAEAILDISKTILPPPTASDSKLFTASPFFPSQNMLPSQHDSDNTVDSDDSIEQEIRAFLAVKAKTEHLIAKSREVSHAFQMPPSLGQSNEQTQSSRQMFPKCLKLPLNRKKKLKRKSEVVTQNEDAQLIFSEMDYLDRNLSKSSVTQLKDERTGKVVIYPKDTLTTISSISLANPLSHAFHGSGSLVENVTRGQQKYGADDKSSSFDSDEDLDTAIKDLLRSKRKLKKKSKDQRVHCKRKVRFGDAEMHIFYKNERDSQPQTPTLLKKCLVSSRRDREGNVKKEPLRKPKGTIEFEHECKKECQTKPTSGAEIQEATKTHPCLWAVTSLADDSSSIDSDDSIEQEIQRFLAEKAKASTRVGVLPDASGVAETFGADKPQAALSKAKWQLLRCGGSASQKEGKKMERLDPPVPELSSCLRCAGETEENASHPSEQVRSFMEDGGSQAQVANTHTVETKGIELPVKRAAVQRKDIWDDRLDQRALSSGKGKAESCKWQNYFKTIPSFKRKSSYEFKISSKFLAGLKGGGNKKKSLLLGKKQGINLSMLKKHGGILAANSFGEKSLPKEIVDSRSEAGIREVDQGPGFQARSLCPCRQEGNGSAQETTVSNEVVNSAKHPVKGHKVDSSQSPPLQEPGIEETREVTASPGVTLAEVPAREGKILEYSSSWAKGKVPDSPCDLSTEGNTTSQGRIAEEQTQHLPEVTGGPMGEHTHCLLKTKDSGL